VNERVLLRKDVPAFIKERRGVEITQSQLDKLCSPAINKGPPTAGYWGNRAVHRPDDVLAWVDSRFRPARLETA
jgi:hypothetical protein